MLGEVHQALGDQAQDIVRSAADTVLESLKNEGLKDLDKKREIEEVIGSISSERFSQLLNLSKKLTDYNAEDEEMGDPDIEKKDAEIDDEVGVAVVFDDEEGFESMRAQTLTRTRKTRRRAMASQVLWGMFRVVTRSWSSVANHENRPSLTRMSSLLTKSTVSESSARDCENQLMDLFDYQNFQIIAKFIKNRDIVV